MDRLWSGGRSPAGEVFAVPAFVVLCTIISIVAPMIFPESVMPPAAAFAGDIASIVFVSLLVYMPLILAGVPAYIAVIALRRKGMSVWPALGLFAVLSVLLQIVVLSFMGESVGGAIRIPVTMAVVQTLVVALLEAKRAKPESLGT